MPNATLTQLCARLAPRLRALFLDAGNTLIHPDWARIADWCAEAGAPVGVERLLRGNHRAVAAWDAFVTGQAPPPAEGFFGMALEAAGVGQPARQQVLGRIHEAERAGTLWLSVRPGTVEALRAFRAMGLVLGVVSNADGRVEQFLAVAGLRPYLDFVVDSALVGVEKPDPRIFQIALQQARVAPDEALHVGDICSVDVAGARRAGIEAVVLAPLGLYESCEAPRIGHLSELAEALRRHRSLPAG